MITLLLFLQVHFELLGEAGDKELYNCEIIVKTLQFAVQIQYRECKLFFHIFKCSCVSCAVRYSTKSESLIFYIMLAAFKVLLEMDSSLFFGVFSHLYIMSSLPAVTFLSERKVAI